jgi:glyoxylase-like metal-dependent hydrolase (beta-lactamase superfamily II)
MLGANGPRHPSAPLPLDGDTIMLEGHPLKVIGPMQGDHVHATALYAPAIRALFGGDLLFNEMHLWLGEHGRAETRAWRRSLDTLAALKPEMAVAGHSKPGMPNDASSLDYTRRYLDFWLNATRKARNSAELMAMVKAAFPGTIDVLNDFLLPNSAKVAMGEEPRWQE